MSQRDTIGLTLPDSCFEVRPGLPGVRLCHSGGRRIRRQAVNDSPTHLALRPKRWNAR